MAPLYGTDTTDGLRRWKFVTMPHQRSRRGHGCPVRAGSASLEMAVRNCQPIKGVTIFHVESRDRSTRPLTTPPPWTSMASSHR